MGLAKYAKRKKAHKTIHKRKKHEKKETAQHRNTFVSYGNLKKVFPVK